ncbi:Ribonucleotide reductase of class III (anaerobic), large subunit [Candidatus Nitrosotalea sp. TS]|uniref:ATP cone domain-containing protein n=1 Tax=Candidatus Nitrosotalea sp. TS TaxID=2341020 RepID=UPI001ED6A3CD|nr:ATP cone domain-containing protein [Candidatus Nitrosotalea sp. TS]NHI04239.1 Ribonucleotide reductase of class III (anaerobic), large subunit [Candidatus Nitrosotalea sp. TS]
MTDFSQIENSIIDVKKRDGRVSSFQKDKISNAIYKALVACGRPDHGSADKLANRVIEKLVTHGYSSSALPSVEDVQDMVESTLIDEGLGEIAKAYILYRHERRRVREEKSKVLESQTLDSVAKKFDLNCLRVLASRYLLRNNKGQITESPGEMFERVATLVGISDVLKDPSIFSVERGDIQNTEGGSKISRQAG